MDAKVMKRVRWLCLLMLAAVVCLLFFCHLDPWRSTRIFNSYINLIPFVFFGITLCLNHTKRSVDVWLGYAWIGWFVLSRVLLKDLYLVRTTTLWFHYDSIACLFALGFAWAMQDGGKKHGLRIAASLLAVIVPLLCLVGLYAFFKGEVISIPRIGGTFGMFDERLILFTHPNTSAEVIVLAVLLGVWLVLSSPYRRWLLAPALVLFVILCLTCSLTTSRTSIIQISCFLGMMAAVAILRHPPKWLKNRWMALCCAAVAAALVFVVSNEAFQRSVGVMNAAQTAAYEARVEQSAPAEEAEPKTADETAPQTAGASAPSQVRQRPISESFTTLTGRTAIFERGIEQLLSSPRQLWLGTVNRAEMQEKLQQVNAHNAYLQAALSFGLPGLLLAVCFTLRALWLSFKVFFLQYQKASLGDLILACILPVMLLTTITESVLFYDAVPIVNVIFFLTYGYLSETERRLRVA